LTGYVAAYDFVRGPH